MSVFSLKSEVSTTKITRNLEWQRDVPSYLIVLARNFSERCLHWLARGSAESRRIEKGKEVKKLCAIFNLISSYMPHTSFFIVDISVLDRGSSYIWEYNCKQRCTVYILCAL